MRLTVNVTDEDIATGEAFSCRKCPVALAMMRAIMGSRKVEGLMPFVAVSQECISAFVPGDDGCVQVIPARPIVEFIDDFDHGRPVRPFSFEIDAHLMPE
jgi:hypothetical protein